MKFRPKLPFLTLFPFLISMAMTQGDEPLVIAHRGASGDAPENTMAAFNLAWEQGADGIEGDFLLTKDGRIIAMHDRDTKRVTDGKSALSVSQSTLAELQALDVGSWKAARYAGEKAPTLEEVLDSLPEDKLFFIEIKCGPEIMPALKDVIAKAEKDRPGLSRQLVIICFNESVIEACREQLSHIPAHFLHGFKQDKRSGRWSPTQDELFAETKACNASGLDVNANPEMITPEFVKRLRDAELEFHCWTVDDAALAKRFRDLGVDSITTNYPKRLREELGK